MYEQLDWLPNGVWLEREEVAEILVALRALIQGTDAIEPNRSHISRSFQPSAKRSTEPEVNHEQN
jgi:hypothetical protein